MLIGGGLLEDPKEQARRKFDRQTPPETDWLRVLGRYATDPPLAVRTLLDAARPAARPGARFCELGFGTGWLLQEMAQEFPDARLFGVDMSPGSVRGLRETLGDRVDMLVGDMDQLPFRDEVFDVIATCWTLYFMNDIDATLREIKRCLAPGGILIAATTAPDHMKEFSQLADEAVRSVGAIPESDIGVRFDTETGEALIRRNFENVELRDWRGELKVEEPAPLLVLWPGYGPQTLTPAQQVAAREAFSRLVQDRLSRQGVLRITRHDGAFVAKK